MQYMIFFFFFFTAHFMRVVFVFTHYKFIITRAYVLMRNNCSDYKFNIKVCARNNIVKNH